MKRIMILATVSLFAIGPIGAAQLYRWVDDKGNVEWRDTPPPSTAKKVEQRTVNTNTIQTSTPSFSAQQAARNFPVTLWVFDCGEPCTNARAHLARRSVPHTEKNAQTELDAFRKLTGGGMEVPLLFVGSTRLKGYLEADWDAALDAAGYPRVAAGAKPPAKPPVTAAAAKPPEAKPAPENAPAAKPAPAAAQQTPPAPPAAK